MSFSGSALPRRSFLLAAPTVALGGCSTSGSSGFGTYIEDLFGAGGALSAANVQKAAQGICGAIPTVAMIAALFTANPALTTASQVAALACGLIDAQKAKLAKLHTRGAALKTEAETGKKVLSYGTTVVDGPNGTQVVVPVEVYAP